jgi:hypothetical protein
MSQHNSFRTRLQLVPLEDRATPSASFGNHWNHGHSGHSHAPAHVGHGGQQSVPITLSTHITSDGSGKLELSGVGTLLGHWTGHGVVEEMDNTGGTVTASGTFTMRAQNGDKLFGTFSISLTLADGHGREELTFTGGTGRFAGASGNAVQECTTNWDPETPLAFECDAEGQGNLVLGRPQCDGDSGGKHEKTPDEKQPKVPDVKQPK